jgi:hypothetical protein
VTAPFNPTTPLGEAQQWLRERLDQGAPCPCCTQRAQRYRRKLNSSAIYGLIQMYRAHGMNWGHAPTTSTVSRVGGELARCRYWNLIQEATEKRDDGGRAGWWRITPHGEEFLRNQIRVASHAFIYDNRLQKLDFTNLVSCREALGRKFDYDELMAGL